MKTYKVTAYGAHENNSWEWSQTVEVKASTLREARKKAAAKINWPPTADKAVAWKIHRLPTK